MSDLWIVSVRERGGVATQLRFTSQVRAENACLTLEWENAQATPPLWVVDDYGAQYRVRLEDISSILMQHLRQVAEGDAEVALFQARSQARLQEKAEADPVLKAQATKQHLAAMRQAAANQPFPNFTAGRS